MQKDFESTIIKALDDGLDTGTDSLGIDRQPACPLIITKCLCANTPIKLKIVPELGDLNIDCGEPRICFASKPVCCNRDCGNKNSCEFTVEQMIQVEIPITYTVKADVNENQVQCS